MLSRKPESYWNNLISKEKDRLSRQKTSTKKKGSLILDDPYNEVSHSNSNKHSP
jgi:hypothetical protein